MAKKKAAKTAEAKKTNETAETTGTAEAAEAAAAEETVSREEYDKLREEFDSQKEQFLRMAAEYDNFRKRTEKEKLAIYTDATVAAAAEILTIADNIERALEVKDADAQSLRKGIEMIETQLRNTFKKLGIEEMAGVGEEFNPDLHNAVAHIEDENLGENVVSAVYQKGYLLGDKVVRHAMVQVAN